MKGFWTKLHKGQKGITGLETAIILIAFIVVASVFAYIVVSSGLFSSQKTNEVVKAGLDSTRATIEVKGNIIADMSTGNVTALYVYVGIPAAGGKVDFDPAATTPLVITYVDSGYMESSMNWTLTKVTSINADNILDPNELFLVTIDVPAAFLVQAYDTFTLQFIPSDGPILQIDRTVPGRVSNYVNLY